MDLAIDGWEWRTDQLFVPLSRMIAALANYTRSKKTLRPRVLYRPMSREARIAFDKEERRRDFEDAVRRMGPQAIPVRPRHKKPNSPFGDEILGA